MEDQKKNPQNEAATEQISDDKGRSRINSLYSGEFQMKLFGLDSKSTMEPVLDVSCGPDPQLVLALRMQGLQAYGADIDVPDYPFIKNASWTVSNFGQNQWGTILSNIGVAETINTAISEKSDALEGLTLAYYNLLGCLKTGGRFIYAPSIPGLEETIPSELFNVEHEEVRPGLEKTTVTKISEI